MYEKSHVIVAAGFLSLTLGGGIWYLKEDARERVGMHPLSPSLDLQFFSCYLTMNPVSLGVRKLARRCLL